MIWVEKEDEIVRDMSPEIEIVIVCSVDYILSTKKFL